MKKVWLFLLVGLFLVGSVSAACSSGMVSYWTFDTGDVINGNDPLDVFGDNDGISDGNLVVGKVKQALDVDWSQSANIPDDNSLDLGIFTTEAWFKIPEVQHDRIILAKGGIGAGTNNYGMVVYDGGIGTNYISDGLSCNFEVFGDHDYYLRYYIDLDDIIGEWIHMACVFDASQNKWEMYVNGTKVDTEIWYNIEGSGSPYKIIDISEAIPYKNAEPLYIGRDLKGTIDEVAIYNRALTPTEISENYQKGLLGFGYCEDLSSCIPEQIIMKLSSPTNAHGALWNDANYNYDICYSDIFGVPYVGTFHPLTCLDPVVWLSDITNAHAENPEDQYTNEVCYGDLNCRVRDEANSQYCDWANGEKEVVALYEDTNSHFTDPNYIPSGAVGYWKLNGNADSLIGPDGVNNGAVVTDGKIGTALDFDGVGDYVEVVDDNSLDLGVFTTEAWFKIDRLPNEGEWFIILRKGDYPSDKYNYHLSIMKDTDLWDPVRDSATIHCAFENGADEDYNLLFDIDFSYVGKYTHVACTLDGDSFKLYVDGVDKTSDSYLYDNNANEQINPPAGGLLVPTFTSTPLFIGAWRCGTDANTLCISGDMVNFFDGQIDEVVIYNRALTPEEVQDRYNVGAYEKKVCCGVSAAASAIRWEDMDGNPIVTSNIGQWVRMVKTSASSGDFEIREDDGTSGDDNLYVGANNISGVNENGNRVGIWHITQADFEVADEGSELDDHQIEAYFTIGLNVSGNLNISDQYIDYPMIVTLESPLCGENYTVGVDTWINVTASDPNDKITGNVSVGGVKIMDFTNGGNSTLYTWPRSGNIQVELFANNSRGYIRRTITSIMVTDDTTKDYVAACINKPADFSDITSSNVKFEADRSRGLKCTLGVCDEVGVDGLWFSWRFSDGLINYNHDGSDSEGLAYNFYKNFATAGHNWAVLDVKII